MPSLLAVVCSVLSMSTLACRFTIWVMPPRRFFNNRMNEVIDFICFHQLNALALIEFTHAIQEHFHQLFLGQPLIRAHWSDVLSLFPSEAHEAILAMIALHGDLQEERIGHLWCCDVMECMESTPNAFKSYRVHCTIRGILPMSSYRRSSTASPCTRINWYHLVGWHVAKHKISTERYGQDETLIECERTVQLHFLFPTSKQFDHTKQTGQHEKGRLLFNPILYRQLEPNLPFNRMLFLPFRGTRISWIESGYHRNAMFSTDRQ